MSLWASKHRHSLKMIFLIFTRFHSLTLFYVHPPPVFLPKQNSNVCKNRPSCSPPACSHCTKLLGIIAGTLLHQLDAPQCHWRTGSPILGAFSPKVVHRPIVGGPSPKQWYGPQSLNSVAQYFQCLTEGTNMLLLSKLLTTGVNLPSADVEAAPGGLLWWLPKQNIVEKLICAYQQQLVTINW